MSTIKDVAERAGVTIPTVSRVLNNKGYISDKMRRKVYETMEELNYYPNELARSLVKRKSNLIGLIVPNVAVPYFAELTSFIEDYAFKNGYKLLLCNACQDSKKEKDCIQMLKRNQVDGIIIASHTMEASEYLKMNMPAVTLDRFIADNIPCIASDNYYGGIIAGKHLIEKGCKKIACIKGQLTLDSPLDKRYAAFINIANAYNIPYVVSEAKLNSIDMKEYEDLAYQLFKDHPDIDGIFASNDFIVVCMMKALNNMRKSIPEDVRVIGYDDVNRLSFLTSSITKVKQPVKKIGQLAVEIIINQIEGKKVNTENILPLELIEGSTT